LEPRRSASLANLLNESDKRYKAYLAAGGKPPVAVDKTPEGKAPAASAAPDRQ
jgi:hypothetical protein